MSNQWTIGQRVRVLEFFGRGREVYQCRIVRLTATQVLTANDLDAVGDYPSRWRLDGKAIGGGERVIRPLETPAEIIARELSDARRACDVAERGVEAAQAALDEALAKRRYAAARLSDAQIAEDALRVVPDDGRDLRGMMIDQTDPPLEDEHDVEDRRVAAEEAAL